MISVRYISWDHFDELAKKHVLLQRVNKDDAKSVIFDEYSRIKQINGRQYAILGRTPKRELMLCVANVSRKYTLSPIYIRPMNIDEKRHYQAFLPEHLAELKGLL